LEESNNITLNGLRVAIIVSRIAQLGPVKVMQALANSLSIIEGLKVKIFYFDKKIDTQLKFSVPFERIGYCNFNFRDFDIIHTNGIRPDFFAWKNRKKIKYHISTIHNFVFEDLAYTYNKFISLIFGNIWFLIWGRADKLVCVSKTMKDYYSKRFSSSKLEVVYNGIVGIDISLEPDKEILKVINQFRSKGLKVIGSIGILTKRKGFEQILNLIKNHKEYALIVIGAGKELVNLKKLARKNKIFDQCLFCGFISNAVKYFNHFDYIIIPSRSEGFGLVLIEAVQQKVPVICSDIEVFKELFDMKEVTFFKLDELHSLLEALKVSSETGKEKVDIAFSKYLNNYTNVLMAKQYFELYQTAL